MAKRPPSIPRLAPLQRIASYPVRVLVVAGEDTWRGAVVKFLAAEGFDVKEADTTDRALAHLAQKWPEVLVLDLQTPKSEGHPNDGGMMVLQALAGRPDRPGVVAFAADPSSSTADAARELGAIAVLDRRADLSKLPVAESLGWKICSAWHWHRRQPAATSGTRENT